jgi:tRNA(Arg) A34 adenosine deaminase TadA
MTNVDLRIERDALAALGVLTHAYLTWDPPIPAGLDGNGRADFTHHAGLNIHALVIDNVDGEVLALERNQIHEWESPVMHAEQAAVRTANERLRAKRPRPAGMSVENYYRSRLFYAAGSSDGDFVRKGATLYTTLEPCPMCAATLLVCRMKRVVHVIPDKKFGGAWGDAARPGLKERFYPQYELRYETLAVGGGSDLCARVHDLLDRLASAIAPLRDQQVQDTWFLDRLHSLLGDAMQLLIGAQSKDLAAPDADRAVSERTLADLKRLCRLPG